jgi:hypothetical protein
MEPPSGGLVTQPLTGVRARAEESSNDNVSFADEVDDLDVQVAERGAEWRDPGSGAISSARLGQFVEHCEVASKEHFIDQASNRCLVFLDGHELGPHAAYMVTVTPLRLPAQSMT